MLAEIRARQGRFDDAAAALEEGFQRIGAQMDPDSYLWLVEMYLLAGRKDMAAGVASRYGNSISPAVSAAIAGRLAESKGAVAGAREYEAALRGQPLLTGVMLRLSRLYAAEGRPDAIVPFLEAGIAANPKADSYHQMLGERALARGDAQEAHRRLAQAVEIQPENGLYLGQLATAAAILGRKDEARERLTWAERWQPVEPAAWMAIGSAWDRLGETDRAVAAFDRARAAGLDGPGADVGGVLALARAGRGREAQARLDDARRRFPDNEMLSSLARRLNK